MRDSTKETIIIVHGTWAAPTPDEAQWYQPPDVGSVDEGFVSKLNNALRERDSTARCWAHCADANSIFSWSRGENSWIARTHGAIALVDYVTSLQKEGWRCHIVAHSHGGNVVIEALPQILAAPNSDILLGKIVTLGTPFINTSSAIRKQAERQGNLLKKIGRRTLWIVMFILAFDALLMFWFSSEIMPSEDLISFAFVFLGLFGAMLVAVAVLRFKERNLQGIDKSVQNKIGGDEGKTIRSHVKLLAIGCPTDEAWQLLHHLSTIDDPLAVRSNLYPFLVSSLQSQMLQIGQAARIRGARSFSDVGIVARCIAALLAFSVIGLLAFDLVALSLHLAGVMDLSKLDHPFFQAAPLVTLLIVEGVFPFILAILLALIFRIFFGATFYSAFWSPFRWFIHRLQSLASVGPALGTYFVRRWSWPVLLRSFMGLENYGFDIPIVTQRPSELSEKFATYENMPGGAEQRALAKRSAWVARHAVDVSQTFTKLVVTASDLTSLLRMIEADQTLVHGAYYSDDECVVQIADWIAGKE